MAKEILIYGSIDSYSSTQFIEEVNAALELEPNADMVFRVNTPGGSPEYGWGMVAKIAELPNNKVVKNDGKAHSMGLYFNCYATNCEALDVTEFLLHRAAYPDWIESNTEIFDDAMRGNLERINASLRKAFENKVDVKKFEELKGVKVKDIFSMDNRIDVFLTAQEAKKIGLINKIVSITPAKKAELDSLLQIAAKHNPIEIAANIQTEIKTQNMKDVTFEQLKAENPALVAQIIAMGVAQEKDRVGACMAFADVDLDGVKAIIKSGEPMSQTQMTEFITKKVSKETLVSIESKSEKNPLNTEVETKAKTEKEQKAAEFLAEVKANLAK